MPQEKGIKNSKQSKVEASLHSTSYEVFILVLTIYSWIIVAGIILAENSSIDAILLWSDFLICIVLFIDFLLNIRRSPNKVHYFLVQGGWLDLLGSIPVVPGMAWTALLRLARTNRFLRIIRCFRGQYRDDMIAQTRATRASNLLLTTILVAFLFLTISSLTILRFERGAPGANITTGATAFWWAFVTMTTVGYGDYVPVTYSGRVLAVGLMTFGIGVFAVLTSFVASRFAIQTDDSEDLLVLIKEENAIIKTELAELRNLIKQQMSREDDS